jgi:hypothetical protein
MEVNTERPNMTPGRAAMLTLLGMYRALNCSLSQIEVQKLAYIEPIESALEEAKRFIQNAGSRDLTERVKRVAELIEGFQTLYGMELLSTVHWVATHDPKAHSASDALNAIRAWNTRKRELMDEHHVQVAWDRLREGSWLEAAVR